jgi:hypothetical protein
MWRLSLVLFVLLAAPAHALTITTPSDTVEAHPHVSSLAAELVIKGRAPHNALVEIRTHCELGPCRTSTYANRKGRFTALLDVVLPHDQRRIRLRALAEELEYVGSYRLSLPDYALAPPYSDLSAAPELNVIGDSLAIGTESPLRDDLPGWRVTSDGRVSRFLATGMAVLGMTPLPTTPRALAFGLFTNDDPSHVDELETAVRDSLLRLGSRDCALWATISRPPVGGRTYGAANRRLRALAAEDDRVRIVEWARAVKHHREWLTKDKVHPTPEGYAARARLFARAATQCGEQW